MFESNRKSNRTSSNRIFMAQIESPKWFTSSDLNPKCNWHMPVIGLSHDSAILN